MCSHTLNSDKSHMCCCDGLQPEDATKELNLRPPKFFVASTASQRNIDSPRGDGPAVKRAVVPPVVIVSYGSISTPTAQNFHHGVYALAQPDASQVSCLQYAKSSLLTHLVTGHLWILLLLICLSAG